MRTCCTARHTKPANGRGRSDWCMHRVEHARVREENCSVTSALERDGTVTAASCPQLGLPEGLPPPFTPLARYLIHQMGDRGLENLQGPGWVWVGGGNGWGGWLGQQAPRGRARLWAPRHCHRVAGSGAGGSKVHWEHTGRGRTRGSTWSRSRIMSAFSAMVLHSSLPNGAPVGAM